MVNERMLDKERQPTPQEMTQMVGAASGLWAALQTFIGQNYAIPPEVIFGGGKYGWQLHYRRGGRTLCDLYPERGGFTVLVVLGKQESGQMLARLDEFSPELRRVIDSTQPFHDGRWLWIRPTSAEDVAGVETLLTIKRKPKRR